VSVLPWNSGSSLCGVSPAALSTSLVANLVLFPATYRTEEGRIHFRRKAQTDTRYSLRQRRHFAKGLDFKRIPHSMAGPVFLVRKNTFGILRRGVKRVKTGDVRACCKKRGFARTVRRFAAAWTCVLARRTLRLHTLGGTAPRKRLPRSTVGGHDFRHLLFSWRARQQRHHYGRPYTAQALRRLRTRRFFSAAYPYPFKRAARLDSE